MRIFTGLLVAILGLGITSAAYAESQKFELEKPHTQIGFYVSHLGFSFSHGRFLDFDGIINFDEQKPEASNVEVTVKTNSLEMNDQKWNEHMKGADFFDVEQFPEMTFKSTAIEVTGENTANITGNLALHGVTKPVVLETVFNKAGKHPFNGKHVAGFSAKAHLNRSDFGITYGIPNVGDDVEIRIEVEAHCIENCPEPLNQ